MRQNINISIATPCHENWEDMTIAGRSRFCASCQKNVVDFTKASDRQIAQAFSKEANLCGRFLESQLNHDLVTPKEKKPLWMAATTAILAFFALGTTTVAAQTKTKTVQQDKAPQDARKKIAPVIPPDITGLIIDAKDSVAVVSAKIRNLNLGTSATSTLFGRFSITAQAGDVLEITDYSHKSMRMVISNQDNITIAMEYEKPNTDTIPIVMGGAVAGVYIQQRQQSFLGRTFRSIGNLFR